MRPTEDFKDLADFLMDVRLAGLNKNYATARLSRVRAAAPTTAGNESTGADGGFATPPQFVAEVMQAVTANTVVGQCTILPATSSNAFVPVDENPHYLSTGVAWENELAALDHSRPQLQLRNMRLNKVTALIPASSELVQDSAATFAGWVKTAIPARIGAALLTSVVRGTGLGQPLGILACNVDNAGVVSGTGCAIDVARTTAGEVHDEDFANLFNRMHGEGRSRCVFLASPDISVSSTPGIPGRFMEGQPVETIEPCSAIGDRGDLICADLQMFVLVMRTLQMQSSLHFAFDSDAQMFRAVLRASGNPLWSKPYAGQMSAIQRSPFVVLADAEA